MSDEELEAVIAVMAVMGVSMATLCAIWMYMRLIAHVVTCLIG